MRRTPAARRFGALTLCVLLLTVLIYELLQGLLAVRAEFAPLPSTIFLDSSAATLTITTVGADGTISYSVTDLSGATVRLGQANVSFWYALLTLPRLPDGYYVLHIVDHTGSSSTARTIPFAIIAPFTPPASSPFGVGVHFTGGNDPRLTGLLATMGAGMARDDATWASIERTPGHYSFAGFDTAVQALQQNNIAPLLVLDYNNRFYDNGKTPYDSAGFKAFASYARAVVSHYGPQLKAVEVYNEYNGLLSSGPCARRPDCYAQLLRATYQAVKSVRPDVTVVGGALYTADLSWFGQLFQDGGLRYIDAVSDHPYTAFLVTSPEAAQTGEEMTKLEALIKQYNNGQPKPIWITEMGWPTSFLHVSGRTQADYLVRSAVLSFAAGAQKFFWYDLLNDGSDTTNDEQNFGLLNRPDANGRYTPKPAYVAYAVLARQLANQRFVASEPVGWGIYSERFTNNVRVLWSILGGRSAVLFTQNPITVTTMTGQTQLYTPTNGHIVLKLSGDPLYLQGAITKVAWDPPVCGPPCA